MKIIQSAIIATVVGVLAVAGTASAEPTSPQSTGLAINVADEAEMLSGDRGLGERCTNDCQCASRECKGFKCVTRDYDAHPSLPPGKECRFAGDCASCDCAAFRCR